MHVKHSFRIIIISCFLVMLLAGSPQNIGQDHTQLTSMIDDYSEIEKQHVYAAAPIYDYVDTYITPTRGTHTNPPPNGMGDNETGSTTLTETQYSSSSWSTIQSEDFSSNPSWPDDDGIGFSGGEFFDTTFAGTLEGPAVNTSGSNEVRFTVSITGSWSPQLVQVWFWNTTSEWTLMLNLEEANGPDYSISSTSGQFLFNGFKVKLTYAVFSGGEEIFGDDWIIQERNPFNYHAFDAVYTFNAVSHDTHSIEELVIDFSDATSSNEDLEFFFEAGDSSPDYLLSIPDSSGDVDIVVNISQYLTEATCYLRIQDTTRTSSDGIANEWIIDRLYINLTEPSPSWNELPSDQYLEYGDDLNYPLDASIPLELDTWWINDTTHFAIDGAGVITNSVTLSEGEYGIHAFVNDTLGREIDHEFTVFVDDSVDPTWDELPTNQYLEYGNDFAYDLNASDIAGISSWHLNDTANFDINLSGVITNSSDLIVQYYGLLVTVEDNHGNTAEVSFSLLVNDTIAPEWIVGPDYQFSEYMDRFEYELSAFDIAGISWGLNNTDFSIDSSGTILNATLLNVGNYSILVTVTDSHGLILEQEFIVEVRDTTPPNWDVEPPVQNLEYGQQFALQLYVTDRAGIVQWGLNDTDTFSIDSTGFLTSDSTLTAGWYYVNVTAVDGHGLSSWYVVRIFVTMGTSPTTPSTTTSTTTPTSPDTTTPSPTEDPTLFLALAIGGIAIGAVVLFASLRTWRAVQKDRLRQIEASKGEVDTALDYLDSIKSEKDE